jgi:hypothetical protein
LTVSALEKAQSSLTISSCNLCGCSVDGRDGQRISTKHL